MVRTGENLKSGAPDLGYELARRVREVARAADKLRTAQGLSPLANGTLMEELLAEQRLSGSDPWGSDPVMAARNLAGTGLVAAIDYLRSFASTIEAHQPLAPFLNARGVIEACAVSAYLAEQKIGPRERVRRVMNERLLDIHDHLLLVRRLRLPATSAEVTTSEQRVQAIIDTGASLGYTAVVGNDRRPFALDESRPSSTAIIEMLLTNDLGRMLYHVMSSPSHSRPGGLLRSIEVATENSVGPLAGSISLTGKDVTLLTSACLLATGVAMGHLIRMNGWNDEEWKQTYIPTLKFTQEARIHWWGE